MADHNVLHRAVNFLENLRVRNGQGCQVSALLVDLATLGWATFEVDGGRIPSFT